MNHDMTDSRAPNHDLIKQRFRANMARLGNISQFVDLSSPEGAGAIWKGDNAAGARGDILRAMIVLLHAMLEDAVRSYQPPKKSSITLSAASDIRRALKSANLNVVKFEDLIPSVVQLANRRHRIVHHADVPDKVSEPLKAWNLSDEIRLVHWLLVVPAFVRRIWRELGETSLVEDRARENVENGLRQFVDFARSMEKINELARLASQTLNDGPSIKLDIATELKNLETEVAVRAKQLNETLRLEVSMFLDDDGKPLRKT